MSMNIMITAERKVSFKNKAGKRCTSIQTVKFDALQTSTSVTYEIVESNSPATVYIDWVLSQCSRDETFPIYADDDIFQEREPVGFEIYNFGKEHVQKFSEWMTEVEEQGFTVKFEVI